MERNKNNFEKLIISEAIKISEENKLNLHLKEDKQKLHECSCGCDSCSAEEGPEYQQIEFELVEPDEFAKEAEEASMLSEEVKRMKELLSFNNPLLKS